ncbi:hypothetical protein AVEN_224197-1 [Araneus ventricosus]|uniref:Uncharacterized protein n=1 Tax=Araneus ventricosus TaxID=182803 RepID=A0A4Y2EG69_ARAVE|nr:hypothetical protein AVEN_224197-1 [Araneus ventricosus]
MELLQAAKTKTEINNLVSKQIRVTPSFSTLEFNASSKTYCSSLVAKQQITLQQALRTTLSNLFTTQEAQLFLQQIWNRSLTENSLRAQTVARCLHSPHCFRCRRSAV